MGVMARRRVSKNKPLPKKEAEVLATEVIKSSASLGEAHKDYSQKKRKG